MCNERTDSKYGCNCVPYETVIEPDGLAKAYVPFQKFCSMYSGEKGLVRGTVFPELFSPYCKKSKESCNKCK